MGLPELRDKLNKLPKVAVIPLIVVIVGGAIWIGMVPANRDDYTQPPVSLKCAACGHQERITVEEYDKRQIDELPGGAAALLGPVLKCTKCGKQAMSRQQNEPAPPARR